MNKLMTNRARFFTLLAIIIIAAIYRILPHPANFTPVIAVALFSGAKFRENKYAILLPLVIMFLSDLILGLHNTLFFVYGGILLTVFTGMFLRQKKSGISSLRNTTLATIFATSLFFLLTNFGVWMMTDFYPPDFNGLMESYIAGIPFLQNSLMGNLLFSLIIFGGFAIAKIKFPVLQQNLIYESN